MRYIAWNLALAAWMLISAFVFPHTSQSAALTWVTAVLVGVLAVASRGKPGLRLLTAVVALVLGSTSLFLEGMSGAARISNALVTAIVFGLSSIPGRASGTEGAGSPAPHP
jgi:hypothetical protein